MHEGVLTWWSGAYVAKVKIKLFGRWEAWSDSVRWGQLIRPDGSAVSVLLRTTESPRTSPENSRLLASLQHPSILQLLHATAIGDATALVYERFEGVAMSRVLPELTRRSRHMPVRAALEVAAQVCAGLQHAREQGDSERSIIHPGPCPTEILIDERGHVRLAGFVVMTEDGELDVAPPGYVPPEGCGAEGAWAYGIGALMVHLLSGECPASGSSDPSRHEAMIRRALIRVLARSGEPAPEAVITLIRQCMARQPEARPRLSEVTERVTQLANELPSARLRSWASSCVPAVLQKHPPGGAFPQPEAPRAEPKPSLPSVPPLPLEETDHEPPTEEAPRRTLPIQPRPSQAQRDALLAPEPVVGFAPGDFSHTEVAAPAFIPPEPVPALQARIPVRETAAPEPARAPIMGPIGDVDDGLEESDSLYPVRRSTVPLFLGGFLGMAALWVVGVLVWRVVTVEPTTVSVEDPLAEAQDVSEPERPEPERPEPERPEPERSEPTTPATVSEEAPAPAVDAASAVASEPPEIVQPTLQPRLIPAPPDRPVEPVAVLEEPEPDTVRISPPPAVPEEASDAPIDVPVEDAVAVASENTSTPAPSIFRVEFQAADSDITELQIRCHKGSGIGTDTVVIPDAGRGPCKVIGMKGDERVVTSVSLTGEKVWVCFAAGARSCQ